MKKTLLSDVIQFCVSSSGLPVAGSTAGASRAERRRAETLFQERVRRLHAVTRFAVRAGSDPGMFRVKRIRAELPDAFGPHADRALHRRQIGLELRFQQQSLLFARVERRRLRLGSCACNWGLCRIALEDDDIALHVNVERLIFGLDDSPLVAGSSGDARPATRSPSGRRTARWCRPACRRSAGPALRSAP